MLFWTDAHIRYVDGAWRCGSRWGWGVSVKQQFSLSGVNLTGIQSSNGFRATIKPQLYNAKVRSLKKHLWTWEKAAVVKIMINQMSRHLVRLVKVCLEFHLCVCWRGWCMLCLFSHGIGDSIHRQSSGGLQFWRSQRPEINNHRNEHTTETHHVHPVFCLRLRWHWTGYGCII